jgi:hypothetical protein
MKKLLIIVIIFTAYVAAVNAQGELDEQQKVFFRNERSFAILLNTDGFGASFRAAKRIDFLNKRLIEIDAGILRSSKEYRQRNMYAQGGSFTFGKMNQAIYLRGGIGHQHELFSKEDFGGIAIRYFYSAGPALSLYKPIYYVVIYPISGNLVDLRKQKFESSIVMPSEIYSKAPFTKGLNETKVVPGVYAKAGLNFEYSKQDKVIHAIEIGGQVNAFPKEIPIMAVYPNKKIFFSLFLSYRFGMILDPLHPESNSIINMLRKKR